MLRPPARAGLAIPANGALSSASTRAAVTSQRLPRPLQASITCRNSFFVNPNSLTPEPPVLSPILLDLSSLSHGSSPSIFQRGAPSRLRRRSLRGGHPECAVFEGT